MQAARVTLEPPEPLEPRMRPLLAAAALALTTAGCASTGPSQAVTTSTLAETSAPADPSKPAKPELTRAETAYLKALDATLGEYLEKGESLNAASYIRQGREICATAGKDRVEAVQDAIDGMEAEGDVHQAALTKLCPKHRTVWSMAATGIGDGTHTVGKDIRAGTYRTLRRPVVDCYWERSTSAGRIVDNQLVSNAPQGVTVSLRSGEGFTSRDCGPWVRA